MVLLLAGVNLLPGDLLHRIWGPSTGAITAGTDLSVDRVELANWIVLQTVETAHGPRAVVTSFNEDAKTDLQVGDVRLVYAATGEVIASAQSANALLKHEIAVDDTTFGFSVQRDGKMAVAAIVLPDLGNANLDVEKQDLENKT